MKYFVYKSLIVFLISFTLYHVTIGYSVRYIEIEVKKTFDKDKLIYFKNKIRKEIKNSLKKENILNNDDAKIISQFIIKISKELNLN